jgi:hypothetical protein
MMNINEWMGDEYEWINEWMNEWMNEWIIMNNEIMNEWMNTRAEEDVRPKKLSRAPHGGENNS